MSATTTSHTCVQYTIRYMRIGLDTGLSSYTMKQRDYFAQSQGSCFCISVTRNYYTYACEQ